MTKVTMPCTFYFRGKKYPPGTPVDVPSGEAAALAKRWGEGILAKSASKPGQRQPAPKTVKPQGDALIAAVAEAIEELDPDNPVHFTGSGEPSVAAIEEALGYGVSATERDEAWARVQKASEDGSQGQ